MMQNKFCTVVKIIQKRTFILVWFGGSRRPFFFRNQAKAIALVYRLTRKPQSRRRRTKRF